MKGREKEKKMECEKISVWIIKKKKKEERGLTKGWEKKMECENECLDEQKEKKEEVNTKVDERMIQRQRNEDEMQKLMEEGREKVNRRRKND